MTLREARCRYSHALALLVVYAYEIGLEVAFDEVIDRVTEKDPTTDHMKGSLHEVGLAADLLLYKDNRYCTDTSDYTVLGEHWEQMGKALDLELMWGGRFTKRDGNHFSLKWQGKA